MQRRKIVGKTLFFCGFQNKIVSLQSNNTRLCDTRLCDTKLCDVLTVTSERVMRRPFIFGTAVGEANFIGRSRECERLKMNFIHGVNTILMSPRRWGKTSIVKRMINEVRSRDLMVIYMDVFACRDEYDFCNKFAAEILRGMENRFEEWRNLAENFITRLVPRISYSPDGINDWSVSLGITPKTHKPEEVYQLPELIAQKKQCHILICIDEFQQVGEFSDALSVQKRMRSVWQHQENVSYCLFGSKKHMMESIFLKKSYPFYKFGDIVPIHPIPVEDWIPYIQRGFAQEGKSICAELVQRLCMRMKLHPSYIQQYAWLTLLNTRENATEDTLQLAYNDLLEENSSLFTTLTEHLTTYQANFLRAIAAGVHTEFSSAENRENYNLGSYSNIARIKKALENMELIDITPDGIYFADPILEAWFKRNF